MDDVQASKYYTTPPDYYEVAPKLRTPDIHYVGKESYLNERKKSFENLYRPDKFQTRDLIGTSFPPQ